MVKGLKPIEQYDTRSARKMRRAAVVQQHQHAQNLPARLTEMPPEQFPHSEIPPARVWVSRDYLVMLFHEKNEHYPGLIRLSINRSKMLPNGNWEDKITWDELMGIKRAIGLGDVQAINLYPADSDVVNVANITHLWIVPNGLKIGFGY